MIDTQGTYLNADMATAGWVRSDFVIVDNPAAPSGAAYISTLTIVGDQLYTTSAHYGIDEDPSLTLLWGLGSSDAPILNSADWELVASREGTPVEGHFSSDRVRTIVWNDVEAWVVDTSTGVGTYLLFPTDPDSLWFHGGGTQLDAESVDGFRYATQGDSPEGIRDVLTFAGTTLLDRPADQDETQTFAVTEGFPGYIVAPEPAFKTTHEDTLVTRALTTYTGSLVPPAAGVINYYFQNVDPPADAPTDEFWGSTGLDLPTFHWEIDPDYAASLGGTYSVRLHATNNVGGSGPVTLAEDSPDFFYGVDPDPSSYISFAGLYKSIYDDFPLSEDVPGLHFFPVLTVQPPTGPAGAVDIDFTKFSAWISGQYTIMAVNYRSSPYVFHSVDLTVGGDGVEESSTPGDVAGGVAWVAGVDQYKRSDHSVYGSCWWTAQAAFDDKTGISGNGLDIMSIVAHWEPALVAPGEAITGRIGRIRTRFSGV